MATAVTEREPVGIPVAADPAIERVRDYWNDHVTDWPITDRSPGTPAFFAETEAYRFEKLDYLERVVDYGGYAGRAVLDVGCGLGNDAARFARAGAQLTGIDIAPRAIALATENFAQRGLAGTFRLMDAEAMTLPSESFDFVYCHTVLHFTPRPARVVEEIHRVLKPGGTAFLMAVNRSSWMRLMHRLAKVEIDHLRAPVFHWLSAAELEAMALPFVQGGGSARVTAERFPVRTKVHGGLKARLFNALFVDVFNALPRPRVRRFGHHLLLFATKAGQPGVAGE